MVDLWKASQAINNATTIENQEYNSAHSNDITEETDYTSSEYSYSEDDDDYQADTPNTLSSSHIQSKKSIYVHKQTNIDLRVFFFR
jgi:hypothetical protein